MLVLEQLLRCPTTRAPDRRNRVDFPRWSHPNTFPVVNHRVTPAGDADRWAALRLNESQPTTVGYHS
jgi:hypothetical protein